MTILSSHQSDKSPATEVPYSCDGSQEALRTRSMPAAAARSDATRTEAVMRETNNFGII